MKPRLKSLTLMTALALSVPLAMPPTLAFAQAPAPAAAPEAKTFSQQDLEQLLAPIALYPDPLLAQILMASTYPLEVVQAARWAKANPKVTGQALEDAMQQQPWDPAVKSLTSVPQVLQQMNDKLDWTQKLGDAFLAQQSDIMDTVQKLRAKAAAAGHLKSNEQQVVKTEQQGENTIYVVESPKPEVIYVPTYNPAVVYGTWPYPAAPPYTVYPPAYVYPPGLVFATGILVGAAIWGNCNWGGGWGNNDVNINANKYNNFNRTNISNGKWGHNVNHRGGVAYQDRKVAQQYNRGGSSQGNRARDDFRGRAETGRGEMKNMDRNDLNNRINNADRGSRDLARDNQNRQGAAGDRGNFGDRNGAGNRGGDRGGFSGSRDMGNRSGFSGAGNGSAARDASSRGGASRSGFSGGGRSAGGGGGGARGGGGGGGARGGGGGGGRGGGGRR